MRHAHNAVYVVTPNLALPCTAVSAAPQTGVAYTHLQGGEDHTLRCYRHHDLGVSLQLDAMRLSQAWR